MLLGPGQAGPEDFNWLARSKGGIQFFAGLNIGIGDGRVSIDHV
jgi:hypothetical protein